MNRNAQASWGSLALKQSLTVKSIEVKNMAATSKASGIMMDSVIWASPITVAASIASTAALPNTAAQSAA